jgi:Sulfotransferase family
MRYTEKAVSNLKILEKYSDGNASLKDFYFTCTSNPWRVKVQLAYIAARRAVFTLQHLRAPSLKTDMIVSRRHATILVTIPKSGSRSLLAAFLDRWSDSEGVRGETTSLDSLLEQGLFEGGYRVLAVVRNPWDRVYSCYRDKIARLDRARERAHRIARYRGLRPFMPFEAFVEWLGSDEGADELADRHWASQSAFLRLGNDFRCDHFFKIEHLADEIDQVRSVLGDHYLDIPHINTLGNTTARRDIYNSRTQAIIERRYEEDIDRFQYVF